MPCLLAHLLLRLCMLVVEEHHLVLGPLWTLDHALKSLLPYRIPSPSQNMDVARLLEGQELRSSGEKPSGPQSRSAQERGRLSQRCYLNKSLIWAVWDHIVTHQPYCVLNPPLAPSSKTVSTWKIPSPKRTNPHPSNAHILRDRHAY